MSREEVRTNLVLAGAAIGALISGAVVIRLTGRPLLGSLDAAIFLALNGGTVNPLFDAAMPIVSIWELFYVATTLIAGMLFLKKEWRRGAFFLLFFGTSLAIATPVKKLAHLGRPYVSLTGARTYDSSAEQYVTGGHSRDVSASSSFPSSHAWLAFYFAGFFLRTGWPGWLSLTLASLIAFSRIYLGVHYPSDVLVGALWGMLLGRMAMESSRFKVQSSKVQA